jgi:hypothetical protein
MTGKLTAVTVDQTKTQTETNNNNNATPLLTTATTTATAATSTIHTINTINTASTFPIINTLTSSQSMVTENNKPIISDDEELVSVPLDKSNVEKKSSPNSFLSFLSKIFSFIVWPFAMVYNSISSLSSTHKVEEITGAVAPTTTSGVSNFRSSNTVMTADSEEDSSKEPTLAEKCENPTKKFVESEEFKNVFIKMRRIFEENETLKSKLRKETEELNENEKMALQVFDDLEKELTPYFSRSEDEFDVVKHFARPSATIDDPNFQVKERKMLCRAYHKYCEIEQKLLKIHKEKIKESQAQNAEKLEEEKIKKNDERKSIFKEFIGDLDKMQSGKGQMRSYHMTHMLKALKHVFTNDNDFCKTMREIINRCLTNGNNRHDVFGLQRLLEVGKDFTLYTPDEKRILVRAYKHFMREKVYTLQKGLVSDMDMKEIKMLQEAHLLHVRTTLKKAYVKPKDNANTNPQKAFLKLRNKWESHGYTPKEFRKLETLLLKDLKEEIPNEDDRLLLVKAFDIFNKQLTKLEAKAKSRPLAKESALNSQLEITNNRRKKPTKHADDDDSDNIDGDDGEEETPLHKQTKQTTTQTKTPDVTTTTTTTKLVKASQGTQQITNGKRATTEVYS